MNEVYTRTSFEKISPDVRALMNAANNKSSAERSERQAAARAQSEVKRRKEQNRQFYDSSVNIALICLLALCWIAAGLAFYLL